MKALLFIPTILFCLAGSAQKSFDLLQFQVPEGWETSQSGSNFFIQKLIDKQPICQIILHHSVNGNISNVTDFRKAWDATQVGQNGPFPANAIPETQVSEEWTLYSVTAPSHLSDGPAWGQFYTLTDGKRHMNFQIIVSDKQCKADIDAFFSGMVPVSAGRPDLNSRAKKRRVPKFKCGKEL